MKNPRQAVENPGQVVLLRVGIDTGVKTGGLLGPIFKDGSFEFIPINADRDCDERTYGKEMGRHGRRLIEYFPESRKKNMAGVFLHSDPEFDTFTYGDPTSTKQSLKKLDSGDFLVFYAGLKGWRECKTPAGLYIVGYFVVEQAGTYKNLKRDKQLDQFANNWHILNHDKGRHWIGRKRKRLIDLILVKGGRGSRLLKRAVKISADKKKIVRGGRKVFVLAPEMKEHFGSFTKLNAIERSIPRKVDSKFFNKVVNFLKKQP